MKRINMLGKITGVLLVLAMIGLPGCTGQKSSATQSASMIVVFSTGTNKIIRAESNALVNAEVGTVVNEKDKIKTENGTVDLQTRDGSAIRVREFTTITVAQLVEGKTQLEMSQGILLANVKRTTKSDTFTVATPTAIAGVRGTTFKVELLDETQPPKVKVIDGKVAMSPRIKSLEKYSANDIESDPALKNLAKVQKTEMILEEKTEGTLDPKLEKKVKEVNAALDSNKSAASAQQIKVLSADIGKESAAVIKSESEITVREQQETSTLVAVDKKTFDNAVEGGKSGGVVELMKTHETKRVAKQEKVLQKIESEAAKKKLNTEEDIKKQYNKLELLVLKNGEKIRGAVIAQTGNVLVVHTQSGVQRIKKADVQQQEFLY